MEIRFDRIWYLNNFQSRFWVVEIKSIGIFGMLERLTFAQASHLNHFDQFIGGKINNWWKDKDTENIHKNILTLQIYFTLSVSLSLSLSISSNFLYSSQSKVWLQSNSIIWNKFHHLEQIPSLGTNSITWDKSLPLQVLQLPTAPYYKWVDTKQQAISHQIRNGRTYNYKLPSTNCTRGSALIYLTNDLPSAWLKSRWRRRRGPPTRSPPWSTVSPGGGSTVWGTLRGSLWGEKWGREREMPLPMIPQDAFCNNKKASTPAQKRIQLYSIQYNDITL